MNLDLERPLSFFDLETTGVNAKEDYIVEIAIIRVDPYGERRQFSTYVKPPIPIPEAATKVHGITNEMVKDAPAFKDIGKAVLDLLSGSDIGGFNSNKFDIPLLYNEFKRAGFKWGWQQHFFVDVGNLYKIKEARTLGAAYQFYTGKNLDDAHEALADVEATMLVFGEQMHRYEDMAGKSIEDIALMSNFDKKILDITGFFGLNENNEIIFNYGKHAKKVAKTEKSYLQWMLNPKNNFDPEVLKIAEGLLYGQL